ncbi:MAG: hypothetical protein AVDCRST_MAG64-1281, partial [uncultured Phycisphaerae bacterium]
RPVLHLRVPAAPVGDLPGAGPARDRVRLLLLHLLHGDRRADDAGRPVQRPEPVQPDRVRRRRDRRQPAGRVDRGLDPAGRRRHQLASVLRDPGLGHARVPRRAAGLLPAAVARPEPGGPRGRV